jgi:hypothetical protein
MDVSQGKQGEINPFNIGGSPCAEDLTVTAKSHRSNKTFLTGPDLVGDDEIESVTAAIGALGGPALLKIMRDDTEWRFILSGIGLITAREARDRHVRAPNPLARYSPEASVYFVTGECILDVKP